MSDLNGRVNRAVEGYRARWELAGELQPNPYVQYGKEDSSLCAVFHNRVYLNGELVTDRTARLPNMVAVTEQQLRTNDIRVPYDLPKKLREEALQIFAASHKPKLVYTRDENPAQMAAEQPQAFQMKG